VASIKTSLAARPDAIEACIDPVTLAIEHVGTVLMAQGILDFGASIEPAVDAVSARVPAVFDAIAAVVRLGHAREQAQE
jgi:hypothetical protein